MPAACPRRWSSRARLPCPIRASVRWSGSRRRTRRISSSATSAPTSCRWLHCGNSSATRWRRRCRTAGWSTHAGRSSSRGCGCASGATFTSSWWRRWRRRAGSGRRSCRRSSTLRATRHCTRRCWRGCSATSASKSDADEHYLGARGLKFYLHPGSGLARKGKGGGAASGSWPRNSPRRRACSRAAPRGSSPTGSRRSRAIGSPANTSNRIGRRSAARSWPRSAFRCTA